MILPPFLVTHLEFRRERARRGRGRERERQRGRRERERERERGREREKGRERPWRERREGGTDRASYTIKCRPSTPTRSSPSAYGTVTSPLPSQLTRSHSHIL